MRDAISFIITSYLAFRLAQVLAEAFTVEEESFPEVAVVCFFVAAVLERIGVGLVEVILVLVVWSVLFSALDIGVVIAFALAIVVLNVDFKRLDFEVLDVV